MQLASFGDSSINILISAYLLTNVYAEFLQMQNDLNLNIMDIMQADGVDFAFPSTSVYIERTDRIHAQRAHFRFIRKRALFCYSFTAVQELPVPVASISALCPAD